MDREEALRYVEGCLYDYLPSEDSDKVEEIMELLRPCEDAIDRKAVLNLATTITTDDYSGNEILEVIEVNDIKALPSIQPKAKVGHWIKVVESYLPYMCSECGKSEFRKRNYCPNCGAEMQEVEE